ncbi:hypothetical protein H920_15601 [Fukomys damarensis]|uniref:Uncharacterized protein n=1 Tax=Fukomys damarensis TaxID=885580 RepID=A0A091CWH5_FUKDA|nr:hypothetical protein H920_15601 [Fukomys damarensis]
MSFGQKPRLGGPFSHQNEDGTQVDVAQPKQHDLQLTERQDCAEDWAKAHQHSSFTSHCEEKLSAILEPTVALGWASRSFVQIKALPGSHFEGHILTRRAKACPREKGLPVASLNREDNKAEADPWQYSNPARPPEALYSCLPGFLEQKRHGTFTVCIL